MPFPKELATPPVTKMCLATGQYHRAHKARHAPESLILVGKLQICNPPAVAHSFPPATLPWKNVPSRQTFLSSRAEREIPLMLELTYDDEHRPDQQPVAAEFARLPG
jgi:hypothetical protein